MLFDQKEFEHKISEEKLKKGLLLFTKNKIELINKTNDLFVFLIHKKIPDEISIYIKAEKVNDYTCFCKSKNYCEHLAACVFYLQKESLTFEKKRRTTFKPRLPEQLKIKKGDFEECLNAVKFIIKPFKDRTKLNSDDLEQICEKIIIEKSKFSMFNKQLCFDLAAVSELNKLVNFMYSEKKNTLTVLIEKLKKELEQRFRKGLSEIEKIDFIAAAHYSVKSQANFKTNNFSFLIKRVALLMTTSSDFEKLQLQLKKRQQSKNRLEAIDRKLIVVLQLYIMAAALANKQADLKKHESTVELPIALAELAFLQNKSTKAFETLVLYGEKIKALNLNKYLDFVDEAIILSKENKNEFYEHYFLLEKFVFGFYINEKELQRFFDLKTDISFTTTLLIERLKEKSVFYTFEKVATILMQQNQFEELIIEIKQQKNKFRLLHKIATQYTNTHSLDFFKLYAKQLTVAIQEAKFPYFQEQILILAKNYIDILSANEKEIFMPLVLDHLLYERYAYNYLSKFYLV